MALIGKHIVACLFLPKMMLVTKYDHIAHFMIVQQKSLKLHEKWTINSFLLEFLENGP